MVRLLYFCLFQLSHQHWRCNPWKTDTVENCGVSSIKTRGRKTKHFMIFSGDTTGYIYIAYIATIPLQPIADGFEMVLVYTKMALLIGELIITDWFD